MEMKNWNARRAGGRITVVGIDTATGKEAKIVGIDTMTPGGPNHVSAIDRNKTEHKLLTVEVGGPHLT